jgi:ABC-2 type transport system ATP-binding protein
MPIIHTAELTQSYGTRKAIESVSLSVERGEILGFLGPNGAGKSTTIRILLGFLKAASGRATILDQDCWTQSATIKRDVGYVPGDVRLYPWLTASRAIKLASKVRGQDLRQNGLELCEIFALEPNLPVRKMSRGNRQKLSLLLALAHRPRVLVLDEPTSGLDPIIQVALLDQLREMSRQGHTVLFSSHTISEVETLCSRVAMIRRGKIVVDQPIESLRAKAPRVVHMQLRSEDAFRSITWPNSLVQVKQEGVQVEATLLGSSIDFANWLVTQPIVDFSIIPPSLDALFRDYYELNGASEPTTGSSDGTHVSEGAA